MTEDRLFIRSHYNLMSWLWGEVAVLCCFTQMHVIWAGARWQGHLFLLLSMWGGTRLWMTAAGWRGCVAPSSPLAPCLCSCPHTARSRLTRPEARRAALLSPLRPCGAKIKLCCSARVCTCNLMRGISKHLSKSALAQKHSFGSFLGRRFHFRSHRYLPT